MSENKIDFIIDQAKCGNELPFNTFFEETYKKLYPKLCLLTRSSDDIKDSYLASMLKFWERFVILKEDLPNNPTGYIYIMCKNALLLKKRNTKIQVDVNGFNEELIKNSFAEKYSDERQIAAENNDLLKHRALSTALDTLSPKCKALMELEFDKEIKIKDLMVKYEYSNYQALVQAKYNCKKRLVKKVIEVLKGLKLNMTTTE